jgi:hypothetical protein
MAHLKAQETRSDRLRRKEWKLALTRRLYEQGYEREDVINLFHFIDWLMSLPLDLELEFRHEIEQLEAEGRMPYITSVERSGIRQGLLEGIELGLKLKFGSEGLEILPEISQFHDIEQLRAILKGLETVSTLQQLRQIYQPTTSD